MSKIKSSILLLSSFLAFALLIGCNVKPVYQNNKAYNKQSKTSEPTDIFIKEELAKIKISPIDFGSVSRILQRELKDKLYLSDEAEKDYLLVISLRKNRETVAVERSREVTRYKMNVNAKFSLREIETGKEIFVDNTKISGSFDATNSDFATYAAEEDALKKIMIKLADDIKNDLIIYFASLNIDQDIEEDDDDEEEEENDGFERGTW